MQRRYMTRRRLSLQWRPALPLLPLPQKQVQLLQVQLPLVLLQAAQPQVVGALRRT